MWACDLWSGVPEQLFEGLLSWRLIVGSLKHFCVALTEVTSYTDSLVFPNPNYFSMYRNINILIQQQESEFKRRPVVTQSLLSRMEKLRSERLKSCLEILLQDTCTPGNWIWIFKLICRVWSSAGRRYWRSSFQSGLSSWQANPRQGAPPSVTETWRRLLNT